jgi:uncharacterized protein involved in exopolysaccharide biosynthesis
MSATSLRPSEPPPSESAVTSAPEDPQLSELGGLILRAPLRRRRLAGIVFGIAALGCVVTAVVVPRSYAVDTKILTQRNLVMPSLGNPRRSVPMDSDAPTRAAADVIRGRENLVAIIEEANLVQRWEAERPPLLRWKDRAVSAFTPPLTQEDRVRGLVSVLEKSLFVQADDATIRISIEWSHPQTAYEIVYLAQRNFFAGRSAVEVAVIADTIGILTVEADRQREAVDVAFAEVVKLRREALEPDQAPAPAASPPVAPIRRVVQTARAAQPDARIASQLDEKRRAIRAIEDPRQQRIAELEARRNRLLMTYTEVHPDVIQVDAELRSLSAVPPTLAELRREEKDLVARLGELAAPDASRPLTRVIARPAAAAPAARGTPAQEALVREDEPELASAKMKLQAATRRYEDLMDRIDSARIELQAAQAAFKYRYVVVEPPEVPREPARATTGVLAAGGLLLSALLAFFAAGAKDLVSGRFVEPWQVRRKLSIPILADVERP